MEKKPISFRLLDDSDDDSTNKTHNNDTEIIEPPKPMIKKQLPKNNDPGWETVHHGKKYKLENTQKPYRPRYSNNRSYDNSGNNFKDDYKDNNKNNSKNHIQHSSSSDDVAMGIAMKQLVNTSSDEIKTISVCTSDIETMNFIDGSEYKFQNKWFIWVHETNVKDWSMDSYQIIYTIENISDFWKFVGNMSRLDQLKYNFFIMKSNSHPTWEHSTNRNGGTCSIRIDISQSIDIIEQLLILLVNETLTDEINDINGVSFTAKNNWSVIKIWNRDNKNNISNQMPSYLRKIYPSISIKYKENIPEY